MFSDYISIQKYWIQVVYNKYRLMSLNKISNNDMLWFENKSAFNHNQAISKVNVYDRYF